MANKFVKCIGDTDSVPQVVHVGSSQAEVVNEFTYLGACTTCDGSSESEILRRIGIARNCMTLLEKHVWKSHRLSGSTQRSGCIKPTSSRCWWWIGSVDYHKGSCFVTGCLWHLVSPKNPSDAVYLTCYQSLCQGDYRLPSSFKYQSSDMSSTWKHSNRGMPLKKDIANKCFPDCLAIHSM